MPADAASYLQCSIGDRSTEAARIPHGSEAAPVPSENPGSAWVLPFVHRRTRIPRLLRFLLRPSVSPGQGLAILMAAVTGALDLAHLISEEAIAAGTVRQVKVTLRSVKPPVWRRIVVKSDTILGELASSLEAAMGGWAELLEARTSCHQRQVGALGDRHRW